MEIIKEAKVVKQILFQVKDGSKVIKTIKVGVKEVKEAKVVKQILLQAKVKVEVLFP